MVPLQSRSVSTQQQDDAALMERLQEATKHCREMVLEEDPELYATLQYFRNNRNSVTSACIAIRAFNAELHKICYTTKDPMIGKMKLRWWRDTINRIMEGDPPVHPVATMLTAVVHRHKLGHHWLMKMIDAREASMDPVDDITALLQITEGAYSSPLYLTLQAMGIKDIHADHIATHVGKSMGLAYALRSIPFYASMGRTLLPQHALQHHKLTLPELCSEETQTKGDERLTECVFHIATLAKGHIDHARNLREKAPHESMPAFLPAVYTDRYLDRLEKYNFDVFHPELSSRQLVGVEPLRQWASLVKCSMTGTF